MPSFVTIAGIDEALSHLRYLNEKSLKYRLVHEIRKSYVDEESIDSIHRIEADEIVKRLWETGEDASAVKSRRKNFHSIKSSINADLRRLYEEGNNSEGIIIGTDNTFVMSEEAKSEILETFTYHGETGAPVPVGKLTEVLKIIHDILTRDESDSGRNDAEIKERFEELKDLVRGISNKIGITGTDETDKVHTDPGLYGEGQKSTGYEDLEEVEIEDAPDDEADLIVDMDPVEEFEDPDEQDLEEVVVEDDGSDEADLIVEDDAGEDVDALQDEDLEEVEVEDEPADEGEPAEEDDPDGALEEIDDEDLEEVGVEELPVHEEEFLEEGDLDEEAGEVNQEDFDETSVPEETNVGAFSLEEMLEDYGDKGYQGEEGIRKAKILAEDFNHVLSAIDRYYNQYILIPDGEYIVGGNSSSHARPEKKIGLESFYIGKFPVTNALFEIFIEKTGYITTAEKLGYGIVYQGRYKKREDRETGLKTIEWNSALTNKKVEGACWYQPLGPGSTLHGKRNHPVVQVSVKDAIAFAAWTGKRLPTEDEWEAASRTSAGHVFPWGTTFIKELCNTEETYTGDTTPVDQYMDHANSLGLADTLGNVMEWTSGEIEEPGPAGKTSRRMVVMKGGAWISGNHLCLYSRFPSDPEVPSNITGFRCVAY